MYDISFNYNNIHTQLCTMYVRTAGTFVFGVGERLRISDEIHQMWILTLIT